MRRLTKVFRRSNEAGGDGLKFKIYNFGNKYLDNGKGMMLEIFMKLNLKGFFKMNVFRNNLT